MPLTLHPITPSDIPTVVRISSLAFSRQPLTPAMWPSNSWSSPEAQSHMSARDLHALESTRNIAWHCVKDSSGTILAVGKWRLEDEGTYDEPEEKDSDPAPGFRQEVGAKFFGMIHGARKETMGRRMYWHLVILTTDPEHERKGAGRLLLRWGCERADQEGLDCFLDATEAGKPLYERFGFVVQKVNALDLGQFGCEGVARTWSMIRRPRTGVLMGFGEGEGKEKEGKRAELVRAYSEVDDRGIGALG